MRAGCTMRCERYVSYGVGAGLGVGAKLAVGSHKTIHWCIGRVTFRVVFVVDVSTCLLSSSPRELNDSDSPTFLMLSEFSPQVYTTLKQEFTDSSVSRPTTITVVDL